MKTFMKDHVVVVSLLLLAIVIIGQANIRWILEREQQKQTAIQRAYHRQGALFYLKYPSDYLTIPHEHRPLPNDEDTVDGTNPMLYLELACYRKLTGESLAYDDVKEYLSQEYEDDGELRIYTNGRHPEIEKYVEWVYIDSPHVSENEEEQERYWFRAHDIADDYYKAQGIETDYRERFANRAVMDEVIKKEADPSYVMDDEIMLAHLGEAKGGR